jgi:hypothetical protein
VKQNQFTGAKRRAAEKSNSGRNAKDGKAKSTLMHTFKLCYDSECDAEDHFHPLGTFDVHLSNPNSLSILTPIGKPQDPPAMVETERKGERADKVTVVMSVGEDKRQSRADEDVDALGFSKAEREMCKVMDEIIYDVTTAGYGVTERRDLHNDRSWVAAGFDHSLSLPIRLKIAEHDIQRRLFEPVDTEAKTELKALVSKLAQNGVFVVLPSYTYGDRDTCERLVRESLIHGFCEPEAHLLMLGMGDPNAPPSDKHSSDEKHADESGGDSDSDERQVDEPPPSAEEKEEPSAPDAESESGGEKKPTLLVIGPDRIPVPPEDALSQAGKDVINSVDRDKQLILTHYRDKFGRETREPIQHVELLSNDRYAQGQCASRVTDKIAAAVFARLKSVTSEYCRYHDPEGSLFRTLWPTRETKKSVFRHGATALYVSKQKRLESSLIRGAYEYYTPALIYPRVAKNLMLCSRIFPARAITAGGAASSSLFATLAREAITIIPFLGSLDSQKVENTFAWIVNMMTLRDIRRDMVQVKANFQPPNVLVPGVSMAGTTGA